MTETLNEIYDRGRNGQKKWSRGWIIGAGVVFGILLVVCLIVLILALTVFNINDPKIELVSARAQGTLPDFSTTNLEPRLNISLDLKIRVENPNHASFKYGAAKSLITYDGSQVGEMKINPGVIPSRGSTIIGGSLDLNFEQIMSPEFFQDLVGTGELLIQARTEIPGRVSFMRGIKQDVRAISQCVLLIALSDFKLQTACKNHNEL